MAEISKYPSAIRIDWRNLAFDFPKFAAYLIFIVKAKDAVGVQPRSIFLKP
jgi:hypothetical protein